MNEMDPYDPRDPVWKLLGHASRVESSAFFTRNVAREARLLAEAPRGLRRFFPAPRLAFAAVACALVAVAALLLLDAGSGGSPSSPLSGVEAFDPASEMAAVEYLGQLMAVADPGQLDDDSLAELLF